MKKKVMAILMAGILSAGLLAGCGSSSSSTSGSSDNAAAASTGAAAGGYKIALIQQHQTNAFQIGVSEAAEAKAKALGVDLTILSADQDAQKQISQIEQCVSEGYQAILFEPVDPDGLGDAPLLAGDQPRREGDVKPTDVQGLSGTKEHPDGQVVGDVSDNAAYQRGDDCPRDDHGACTPNQAV